MEKTIGIKNFYVQAGPFWFILTIMVFEATFLGLLEVLMDL
jgi:hypothetical protein